MERGPHRGLGQGDAMTWVYIAAAFGRRRYLRDEIRDKINAMGHWVTSQWVGVEEEGGDPTAQANQDIDDLRLAELLILDTIGFRESSGGRYVEFGYALGLGRHEVWVVGPRTNVFTYMPRVRRFENWDDALEALRAR